MSGTVQSDQADAAPRDETARYASLLASGERVILVRQRHWLTFLEAGRWFALALAVGLVLLVFGQSLDDGGISGFLGTILDWGSGSSSRSVCSAWVGTSSCGISSGTS